MRHGNFLFLLMENMIIVHEEMMKSEQENAIGPKAHWRSLHLLFIIVGYLSNKRGWKGAKMYLKDSSNSDSPHIFRLFASFIHQGISFFVRIFRESRFARHTAGKFRRLYLVHFRKAYVQRQLFIREGACRQCGTCCSLLLTCPLLTTRRTCLVYGTCRPQACKVFPIDRRDTYEVELCGGQCGYRFSRAPAENKMRAL